MSERNQCDGCALGLAVNENGNHVDASGRIHMGCTRDRYEASETAQLRARVADLERERDRLNLRNGTIAQQITEARAERDNAYVRVETAERRVAELEAALRSARSELAVLASYVDDPAAEWPNAGLRMAAKAHAREVKRIDAALSGTTSTIDALIADAVQREREACARAAAAAPIRCAHVTCHACANPAAAAVRARGES